ncbi:zinc finger protein 595-like [Ctenocephalides felis]|uniref:zinc finger protein 595-like n=1 Tax=Ctenocephalides felis TaxID=7515 RepID=UPI000E6E1610|nr:zinc finger protein 595-like [Ctenocephalides felis]
MNTESYEDLCRVCMMKFKDLIPIFEKNKFIPQKILYCTSIKIKITDGFPNKICRTCLENLDIAYNFKKLCIKSDERIASNSQLKHQVNKNVSIKNSPVKKKPDGKRCLNKRETIIITVNQTTGVSKEFPPTKHNLEHIEPPPVRAETPNSPEHQIEPQPNPTDNEDKNYPGINAVTNICEICGKSFDTMIGLKGHIKRHADLRPYKCKLCTKAFKESGSLKIHMRNHTGERPYTCEFCSSSFTQKCILKNHVRSHTQETPFKCDLCGRCFTARSNLAKHKTGHRNERKYSCTLCKASFNFNAGLKKHLLTHSEERPFTCEVCNKSFKRKTNLTIHMRIHSSELPYKCDVCGTSFRYNSILKSHLNSKHNIIVPPMPSLTNF